MPHPIGIQVSADILEDAVLRVVRKAIADREQAIVQAGPLRPKPPQADSSLDKKIAKLDERIQRLVALYDSGDIRKGDYQPRYKELDELREALHKRMAENDSETSIRLVMEKAAIEAAGSELTKEQAKMLVRAFVERVEAPLNVDCLGASKGSNKLGRASLVTLRLPLSDGRSTFLAPLYDPKYEGERLVL